MPLPANSDVECSRLKSLKHFWLEAVVETRAIVPQKKTAFHFFRFSRIRCRLRMFSRELPGVIEKIEHRKMQQVGSPEAMTFS